MINLNRTPDKETASFFVPGKLSSDSHSTPLTISPEISRRDFFAAFALAGLNANPDNYVNIKRLAQISYEQADAMIEESYNA